MVAPECFLDTEEVGEEVRETWWDLVTWTLHEKFPFILRLRSIRKMLSRMVFKNQFSAVFLQSQLFVLQRCCDSNIEF